MKTNPFANKVCWITGASSGIGAALANCLNQQGAHLILSSRNEQKLGHVKANCQYPGQVELLPCDMEDLQSLPAIAQKAWSVFQGIDYVFLNAGMAVRDLIIDTDLEMVQKVMNTNFFSNVVLTRALLPLMKSRGQGRFVVTSSICGKFGVPKLGAYSASKHALHGFYESLLAEHKQDGIGVTLITSGFVRTNITVDALKGNGAAYGKMQQSVAKGISPETCARSILKAVAAEKFEALVGAIEKYSVLVKRFFPGFFRWAIVNHPMKKLRAASQVFHAMFSFRSFQKQATA